MPVCPRCFAAARIAFVESYRLQNFHDMPDDPAEVGARWRELALMLRRAFAELEASDCKLCAGHGGGNESVLQRARLWVARFAEVGFSTAAALMVMGALSTYGGALHGAVEDMAEWLRERSVGGARFH
jgi:hypothetical protein